MSSKIPMAEVGQKWLHKTRKRECKIIHCSTVSITVLWRYIKEKGQNDARKWDEYTPSYFFRHFELIE